MTLSRGSSVHPDAWRKILSEAEASLAVESLRGSPVPGPAPLPSATPPPVSPPPLVGGAVAPAEGAPEAPMSWLAPAAEMTPATWPAPAAPQAARVVRGLSRGPGEGVPSPATPPPGAGASEPAPRAPSAGRARPQEAQGCYERALGELEAGRIPAAMALLRRALALAPGDPEIAGAFGRAMKGGR
jgi:hypothetical protein